MANSDNHEESSPLLGKPVGDTEKKGNEIAEAETGSVLPAVKNPGSESGNGGPGYEWTANGLPVGHGSVVGEPMVRSQWNSSLFACLGRNDEFCSSDIEVCLLGSVAPCVLYGSNLERLEPTPGNFSTHCLTYTGLYLVGSSVYGWNCLAPWFSYPSRTAIRRMFNLEGSYEAYHRSCGCCGGYVEDEVLRERLETACDCATHIFCHTCALCQEGRELRRRLPHPGFNPQPVLFTIPPEEQTMGRGN